MYDQDNKNIFYFPFTPRPYVAFQHNELEWLKIPDEDITLYSVKSKKRRLNRYFDYKTRILTYAKSHHFTLPFAGAAIYFFLPMPKRWTKTQRETFHLQECQRTPDLSNLLKAIEDALHPKGSDRNDRLMYHYAGLGKYWVDTYEGRKEKVGEGWIEVHVNLPVYNPRTKGFDIPANVNRVMFGKPEEDRQAKLDPPSYPLFGDAAADMVHEGFIGIIPAIKAMGAQYQSKPPEPYTMEDIENEIKRQQDYIDEKCKRGFTPVVPWPPRNGPDVMPDKINASDTENVKKVLQAAANRKKKKR